jgi:FAD/FMN-containing dehydrogenase
MLNARSSDGSAVRLEQSTVDGFRARLRGPLLLADDPGYPDARTVWNAMIDRRPALVVRCAGVADIVAGVNFAREHGIVLAIKGGGHNIAGLGTCDGGLLLDLSLMRGVWVDPTRRTARAQAGCLLGDLDRETQVHGLAAVLGFVSNTGIAGLTLGGGFGYLTRRFGWTSDTVLSMDVVTADGQLVRASDMENADLFWALRGGGGNFGVVTSFEYQVYPVGPEIMAGIVAWPADKAPQVLDLFRTMTAEAPPELTLVALMRKAPPAPWLAKEIHGKDIVGVLACHTGRLEEGERLVAPLKKIGGAVGDLLQRRTYVSQQALLDATQPKGRRYYWKSDYLPGHPPDLLPAFIEHGRRITSPHTALALFALDGALQGFPADHTPMGNRDAKSVFNATAAWDKPEDDQAQVAWARAAWDGLRRFSTGGAYINFQTEDEGNDRMQAAYGPHYQRLVEVKRKWDPTNLFRVNKNISPG